MRQTRQSLVRNIEARDNIREQLAILENPIRHRDRNPPLIAKLRSMLNDINDALADLGTDDVNPPKNRGPYKKV